MFPARTRRSRVDSRLGAILLLTALLASCSGVEGKYSHEEDVPGEGKAKLSLELKGDHKAVMSLSDGESGAMTHEGTYEVKGDQISVLIAGDTQVFTRDGSKLIGEGFGETIELVKE